MKKWSCFFAVVAIVLSHLMCFVVGYQYQAMLCGIAHAGYSAPAATAFLYAIPFAIAIALSVGLAIRLRKKAH